LPEPALLQVAEPEGPPYGDDEDADKPAELEWLDGVFEPAGATPAERIRELVSFGEVERRGEKRGTRYRASPDVLGES
jgi:hypothetical protein